MIEGETCWVKLEQIEPTFVLTMGVMMVAVMVDELANLYVDEQNWVYESANEGVGLIGMDDKIVNGGWMHLTLPYYYQSGRNRRHAPSLK